MCKYDSKHSITSQQSLKINICADIWSKPGMTASFLGVTSHFIVENKRHSICLAVRHLPSPQRVKKLPNFCIKLFEWNIDMTKVFRVLTDNGSNIVDTCHILEELLEDGEGYEEEKDEEEDESIMDIEEESQSLFDTDVDDTSEEDFD